MKIVTFSQLLICMMSGMQFLDINLLPSLPLIKNEEIKGLLAGHLETVSKGILSKLSTRAVLMQSPVALDEDVLPLLLNHYLYFMKRRAGYTEIMNNYEISIQKNIYDNLGFDY